MITGLSVRKILWGVSWNVPKRFWKWGISRVSNIKKWGIPRKKARNRYWNGKRTKNEYIRGHFNISFTCFLRHFSQIDDPSSYRPKLLLHENPLEINAYLSIWTRTIFEFIYAMACILLTFRIFFLFFLRLVRFFLR